MHVPMMSPGCECLILAGYSEDIYIIRPYARRDLIVNEKISISKDLKYIDELSIDILPVERTFGSGSCYDCRGCRGGDGIIRPGEWCQA